MGKFSVRMLFPLPGAFDDLQWKRPLADKVLNDTLYPSRLNEERCIALYARAIVKLKATATPLLLDCRSELAAIRLEYLECTMKLWSEHSGSTSRIA